MGKNLAVFAAILLTLGLYTNSWWTIDALGVDLDIGLFEAEVCDASGDCESESFSKIMKSDDDLSWFDAVKMRGAQWGGLAALALLLGFIFAGSGLRGAAGALYVPIAGIAGLSGWMFYRIFSTSEIGIIGEMGYSFMCFEAGLILGVFAVFSAAKSR